MTGERNISLDVLRVLACLGVITIHTAGSPIFHHMVEPGTLWYNECLVMDALVRWSVPVFAMLTGFFLLDGNKELPIRKLLTKYVLRMVVALVVWSAFYAATLHMSLLPFGSQGGHFWYLGMVIGLYLSMPILRMIAANKSLLAYFCWTWLFFMCYKFLGRFFALPIDLDNVVFVDYAGFALWGAYSKELLPKVSKWILCAIAGGGQVLTIFAAIYSQNNETPFFSYVSPGVIAFSIIWFYLFASCELHCPDWLARIIRTLSDCTFGIYLVHMWILIQVFFRVHRFIEQPILLTIVCVGMAFVGGFIITYLLKKIPYINKYIC